MKQFTVFLVLLLGCSWMGLTQNIAVKSFRTLNNDLDARVNFPKKDQNGDLCAIIKVVTTENGFKWDGGPAGIWDIVKKTGEFWLYVPQGSKRLTVKHEQLGQLEDYAYPETIVKATVYELILATGKIVTVSDEGIKSTSLVVTTVPAGAELYINDLLVGRTPIQIKELPGNYTYRLEKVMYSNHAGAIEITGEELEGKKVLNVELKPVFGGIKVTSYPEEGATVLIDDEEMEQKTPFTFDKIKSGTHKVTIKKEYFQPKSMEVAVEVGVVSEAALELTANFGIVTIQTKPKADILIDGIQVGNEYYTGKVLAGLHTFETRVEFYNPDRRDRMIELGDSVGIMLTPQPQLGDITVETNPIETVVYLNGVRKGVTPLTIKQLLAGIYEIRLEKEGYGSLTKSVTVVEDKPSEINETLSLKTAEKGLNVNEVKSAEEAKSLAPTKTEEKRVKSKHYKARFLQYSFSNYTNIGLRYGSCKNVGLYISGNKGSKEEVDVLLLTGGLIFRFGRKVYLYTGAGYNQEEESFSGMSYNGTAFEGGLIFRFGPIAASIGLINHKNILGESQTAPQFGIGFGFGK